MIAWILALVGFQEPSDADRLKRLEETGRQLRRLEETGRQLRRELDSVAERPAPEKTGTKG
jgi:hypothetical protein